jgi:hypothetical protein
MKDDQRFSQLSTAMRGLSLLAVHPARNTAKESTSTLSM